MVALATTAVAAALLAPAASASPIGDAEAAIMAAWTKAGGDASPIGARKGDVYAIGDGFALDFDSGKMFFTPDTGAKFVYGAVLDKYESLGGPADSDMGFPTINEVRGLAGPDSRVATFSAGDKPVIFWTSSHGAFVVRGAMNAAWDKLGSSGGVLGVPVADETYDGEVTSQKFSGGQVSWNRQTKEFTTDPEALADQLKGLQVTIEPTAAINMAWRAAGGLKGPLGAKDGTQYPIGGDGIVQNFAGGKVFFSPATGASALESDILAKYESLGGPVGSDLGFPVTNESDAGISSSSRISAFSATDKPVIIWTPDHGAFVVRGAMKAAWDKLSAPSGKLGAPLGDQSVDGDVVSQQFAGGKISWDRAKNTFSTDPSNLASLLSGLQVPGQSQASGVAMSHHTKIVWHWWWLLAGVLGLIILSALGAPGLRRRRAARRAPAGDLNAGYDSGDRGTRDYGTGDYGTGDYGTGDYGPDRRWGREDARVESRGSEAALEAGQAGVGDVPVTSDDRSTSRFGWRRRGTANSEDEMEPLPTRVAGSDRFGDSTGAFGEDSDAVDTDSFPVASRARLAAAGYDGYTEGYKEIGEDEVSYLEVGYPEAGYRVSDEEPDVPAGYGENDEYDEYEEYEELEDERHPETGTGRHAAPEVSRALSNGRAYPTIHLPLDDPYQAPPGYPIKVNATFGLYYTPGSALYHDTLAEIWLSSEDAALANGFVKAD